MCPLIQRACEVDLISRELVRQFQPGSRRGSAYNIESNPSSQDVVSLIHMDTKASSSHLLAFYLFETGVALRQFCRWRKNLMPGDRKHLSARPKFLDWVSPVLKTWLGVVGKKLPHRIDRALQAEEFVHSADFPEIFHSTSCQELTTAISHIKELWRQLSWGESNSERQTMLHCLFEVHLREHQALSPAVA